MEITGAESLDEYVEKIEAAEAAGMSRIEATWMMYGYLTWQGSSTTLTPTSIKWCGRHSDLIFRLVHDQPLS